MQSRARHLQSVILFLHAHIHTDKIQIQRFGRNDPSEGEHRRTEYAGSYFFISCFRSKLHCEYLRLGHMAYADGHLPLLSRGGSVVEFVVTW